MIGIVSSEIEEFSNRARCPRFCIYDLSCDALSDPLAGLLASPIAG